MFADTRVFKRALASDPLWLSSSSFFPLSTCPFIFQMFFQPFEHRSVPSRNTVTAASSGRGRGTHATAPCAGADPPPTQLQKNEDKKKARHSAPPSELESHHEPLCRLAMHVAAGRKGRETLLAHWDPWPCPTAPRRYRSICHSSNSDSRFL